MILAAFVDWIPAEIAVLVTLLAVFVERFVISRLRKIDRTESTFRRQVWTISILLIGLLTVIFLLPQGTNQDLAFGVIGLVVTGALAISSQSIIANGMSGLMLRSLSSFKPGDFIEVAGNLGRVSELGLFHTEIQTPDRDLTTIPNALLMNEPVKVVRASGTIVSAQVSIGYDISRHHLEELFVDAGEAAGLQEPFVQVLELGDFSVVYRVAGFLPDPRRLLAARSDLRGAILDTLSEAGVEIMSPAYMARREVDEEPVLPTAKTPTSRSKLRRTAEDRVFDKAELASGIENQRRLASEAEAAITEIKATMADLDDGERAQAEARIAAHERRLSALDYRIEHLEALHSSE